MTSALHGVTEWKDKEFVNNYQMYLNMRCLFLLFGLLLSVITNATNVAYLNYVENYRFIAVSEMHNSGIPASIKLAQGILESNAGRSYLAVEANNHFGIKCGSAWNGPTSFRKDDDYDKKGKLKASCFRKYESAAASYKAHSAFLKDEKKAYRYGNLFKLAKDDYKGWAKGLQKSGYATNKSYAKLLIEIIETYELHQFDNTIIPNDEDFSFASAPKYKNGLKYIQAARGDSPFTIALKNGLNYKKLIKINENLEEKYQIIDETSVVFLQPKKNKYRGDEEFHVVREGESIFDISQQYGICVDALLKKNLIPKGNEPYPGEKLSLKKKIKYSQQPKFTMNLERRKKILSNKARYHRVKKGDTLYSISKRYKITITDIRILNNLKSDNIDLGQKLLL